MAVLAMYMDLISEDMLLPAAFGISSAQGYVYRLRQPLGQALPLQQMHILTRSLARPLPLHCIFPDHKWKDSPYMYSKTHILQL